MWTPMSPWLSHDRGVVSTNPDSQRDSSHINILEPLQTLLIPNPLKKKSNINPNWEWEMRIINQINWKHS